jgi:hypothetical protein
MTVPEARRRLVLRGLLLLGTGLFGALHALQVSAPSSFEVPWTVRQQARWVARALDDPSHTWSQQLFPEGELFEAEFYGLALANLAQQSGTPEDRDRAVAALRRTLPRLEPMLGHAPFRSMKGWELRGGIMWFGGRNLLRARLLELANDPRPEEVARFHADSATLARLFAAAPVGLLDSFPGKTWPVDNLFAYRSLQLHDRLYGTRYSAGFAKLRAALERSEDPATHLAPSFLALDGRAKDVPRGCALSWSLAVLHDLDPDYADRQWAAYRKRFFRCAFGLCLVREYPPGRDRAMDADSGPMVAGLGMAASGFALAAARAQGDAEAADALQRTGELLGFPSLSWWGKRYLGGEVAFLDVMALWTQSVPYPPGAAASHPRSALGLGLLAAWGLVALVQVPGLRRAWRAFREAQGGSRVQLALEAAAYALLAAHLAVPGFRALGLVVGWLAVGLLSRGAALLASGRRPPVPSAACDSASSSRS